MDRIKLDLIRIDGNTQSRETINKATVAEYADAMTEGVNLPPGIVFFDDNEYWLADGFHRFHAHRKIGALTMDVEVRKGTCRDAILFSVGANATHGLRRTNNDKRRAVMTLLNDTEWVALSDSAIAKKCGVSVSFVGDLRRAISSRTKDTAGAAKRTVQRNGKTYTLDTTKIGKAKDRDNMPEPSTEKQQNETLSEAADHAELAQNHGVLYNEMVCAPSSIPVPEHENAELKTQLSKSATDCQHTVNSDEMVSETIEIELSGAAAIARIKQLEELMREKETCISKLESEKEEVIRLYEEARHAVERLQEELALYTA